MPLTQVSSRLIEDTLRYVLGANGSSDYTFTGPGLSGTVNDPTLTLSRGHTYIFENRNSSGAHPFYIKTSISNGGTNDAYNTGVTNNGGAGGTEIVFTVPHDAPDLLYYQCSSHSSMAGVLKIAGAVADGSITESKLADDAVTADKLANSINSAIAANTAKDLTALSASNLTSGTVPDARFPATLPAINGANLTNLPANRIGRNLIINGAMQVAQRGTSFADSASGSYTLDRFNIQNSSGTPAFTVTQDTDTPNGFNNALKVACTTADASPAAGSFSRIRYSVEAQDLQPLAKGTSSAKAQTLSFYVKTNKTGVYTVFIFDDDNTRMMSASYTVSDTNWNRYTISIPADTTGAMADDNGAGYVIHWGLSLGSNRTSGSLASTWAAYTQANEHVGNVNFADNTSNVWAITGVQLEVGSVATDFEHRSFGQELALCQRYYAKYQGTAYSIFIVTTGYGSNETDSRGVFNFITEMRTNSPSFTYSSSSHFQDMSGKQLNIFQLADSGATTKYAGIRTIFSQSFADQGKSYVIRGANTTSAYFAFDSEL